MDYISRIRAPVDQRLWVGFRDCCPDVFLRQDFLRLYLSLGYPSSHGASQRFKYFLLILFLMAAFLGLNLTGLLDPMAFFFRSLSLAVFPGIGTGIKELLDLAAQSDIKILNYISYGGEVLVSPVFGYGYKAFKSAWFIGILFLFILFLNRIRPRFWCRTLCPLGALLGVFARFSMLRIEKHSEKCTDCNLCLQSCQGAASPVPGQEWDASECMFCFNCFNACPENAIVFKLGWPPEVSKKPDMGRRAVLLSPFRTVGRQVAQGI